mmetsp:Transcript_27564/g.59253  ORF Transcript_27564/g.59253 Transcript_27564/m.59253 type:complete len:130 (-) Transcript_27564:366-755(-)
MTLWEGESPMDGSRDDWVEKEKIVLSDYKTKEEMHALMVEKGFQLKSEEEIEAMKLQKQKEQIEEKEQQAERLKEKKRQREERRLAFEREQKEKREREDVKGNIKEEYDRGESMKEGREPGIKMKNEEL